MIRLTPSESRAAGFLLAVCLIGLIIHLGLNQRWYFVNWLKKPIVITKTPKVINLNTASFKELDSLPGVGPVTAKRIIENRPYGSLADLRKVKGLNKKTREKIISLVTW